jgi:beta-lactamase class A
VLVNADDVVHAASTMKVPVMLELYRQVDAAERSLEDEVLLENRFASIVDGSSYSLDPADDSDSDLYAKVGEGVTVGELMHRMIARSSNLATNALIELVDAGRIQQTIERLGTTRMQVLRGVEDGKAFRQGLNNTATARDLMIVMAAIARGDAASAMACAAMVDVLAAQEFNDLIPAGLPPGTKVAHKTGWITGIRHDAAIVYPADGEPYVLVVLTRGFEDPAAAARAIAGIAGIVHEHR